MSVKIQLKRTTASAWTSLNPTLDVGEIGYETDTAKFKIGNGSTAWTSLAYANANLGSASLDALADVTITSAANGDFLRWNGTAWINDAVNLGTDTTGSFVASLVAGTGVTLTNNSGEDATPTVAIGQDVASSATPTFAGLNLNGSIIFEGATANEFETTLSVVDPTADRTVSLPDASGTLAISGTIALGTDTTGNYVSSLVAGTGIALSNNSGESATPTVALNATIDNLSDVTIGASYSIGDTGPAGGKIFITPSTSGNTTGKYFEVSPSSATVERTWSTGANQFISVPGGTAVEIGTGEQNTINIVAQSGNVSATSAAVYASEYTYGGYSDWFLPSKDELNQLAVNKDNIGGYSAVDAHWASSEESNEHAYVHDIGANAPYGRSKDYPSSHVRPIRSFTAPATPNSGDFLKYNGTAWVNDPINLGTDTVGGYVASLVAGTGVTLTNNSGETATPTIAIGQAVATNSNVTFNDLTVSGNLTVSGTTTSINTETLTVDDNVVVLNNNVTGSPTENAGIEVERGTSTNVALRWNETTDKWETTNDGSAYSVIATNGNIALGTDTTGDYVSSLVAGTNIAITNNSGEGATPTISVSGSVSSVDSISSPDFIQFDTTANTTPVTGLLGWDSVQGTLNLGLSATKHIHIGEESLFRVRNATGTTIGKGTALYASGVESSGRIQVTPYVADGTVREVRFMGLAAESIADGVNGFVQHFGHVRDLDTRGTSSTAISVGDETWAAGDILYVHPTVPGKLTNVAPRHAVVVALLIVRHQTTGWLFVRSSSGGHIGDIHDIVLTSPTDGQFLRYDSASTSWVNDTINLGTDTTGNYMSGVSVQNGLTVSHTPAEGSSATIGVDNALMTNYLLEGAAGNSYGLIGTSQYLDVKNTNGYNKEIELDIAAVKTQLNTDGYLTESSTSTLTNKTLTSPKINENVALTATATELNYVDGVTSAIQTQLDAKAPLNSPTFTGTVSGISKSMVGLTSVDDTSDVNKPVSTAQQTALDLKANLNAPTFTGTVSGISKSMVGLGNLDNTSDVNKPISTATQNALDLKAPLASPTFTGTPSLPTGTTAVTQTLGNNTTAVATTAFIQTALANFGGMTVSDTAPTVDVSTGDFWYDSTGLNLYIYYSSSWIQVTIDEPIFFELSELIGVVIGDLLPNQTLRFDGVSGNWVNSSPRQNISNSSLTTYGVTSANSGNMIVLDSSSAVSVNLGTWTDANVGEKVDIVQKGTGQVTVTVSGSVSVVSPGNSVTTRVRYSTVTATCISANLFLLSGDLA